MNELKTQKRRTLGQRAVLYDFESVKYEVTEQGGVTPGGSSVGRKTLLCCGIPEFLYMPTADALPHAMLTHDNSM